MKLQFGLKCFDFFFFSLILTLCHFSHMFLGSKELDVSLSTLRVPIPYAGRLHEERASLQGGPEPHPVERQRAAGRQQGRGGVAEAVAGVRGVGRPREGLRRIQVLRRHSGGQGGRRGGRRRRGMSPFSHPPPGICTHLPECAPCRTPWRCGA